MSESYFEALVFWHAGESYSRWTVMHVGTHGGSQTVGKGSGAGRAPVAGDVLEHPDWGAWRVDSVRPAMATRETWLARVERA